MTEKEYNWKSFDGLDFYAWSVHSGIPPRAVIALVHGMGEHSRRYTDWAERFTKKGYAFVAMDYRGHGRSGGKKGHTPSYEALMKDVALLLDQARLLFPGIPVVLYGHSLGGNLVLNYALDHPGNFSILVATSPWLRLSFDVPGFIKAIGKVLRTLSPGLVQSNRLETKALSRDPEIVDAYENDPYVHDRISLNMLFGVMERGLLALRNGNRHKLPVLVLHGEEDRITSCPASRELAASNPEHIHLKTWPGCYHELQNEPCKEQVFDYLIQWLDKHLT